MRLGLMVSAAALLAVSGLMAVSPRLEREPGLHRILWESSSEAVYLVERSSNLMVWEAIGPVHAGDGTMIQYEDTALANGLLFYRLLQVPLENLKSPVASGQRPPYLAWLTENADGTVRFDFYALQASDFVDVHYRVNNDDQLNLRMDGTWPRFHYTTPAGNLLSAGDSLSFYFTYDHGGAVIDTVTVEHTVGTTPEPPGGGSGGGSGAGYTDVLVAPVTPADYTHGLDYADGQVTIRIRPGYQPDSLLLNYTINGGALQAHFMNEDGDEWQYRFAAADGDTIAYNFISLTPGHIRSAVFTRVIGSAQPAAEEPLVILGAGRFRDRHENELRFDPYIAGYFDRSTFGLTLTDYGHAVDVTVEPAEAVNFVDIKLYDRNATPHEERPLGERADYAQAHRMFQAGDTYHWRIDDVSPGKFVDLEFTLQRTRTGQSYYTAIFRFYVGAGGLTQRIANPEAYSGGATTVDVYSEPQYAFAQAAHNAQHTTLQAFLNGKRVFDSDFADGGRLGPLYNANSCFACHVNDGAAQPPATPDDPLVGMLVKLAAEQDGAQVPHPDYGVQLQDRATAGHTPEGRAHIDYVVVHGAYGDGTPYTLTRPVTTYSGLTGGSLGTVRTSPRVAPKVIGLGLLEAIPESTLQAWADPTDADADGISGKINQVLDYDSGQTVIGRFGWKAAQPSVRQQVAVALSEDMGVGNPVLPGDRQEMGNTELDQLTLYTQLLGVPLRRNIDDPDVIAGQQHFVSANCIACHKPGVMTGDDHPVVELRGQLIRPYTDLLVHDMGSRLADNYEEGTASGREWRTAPLWGIGRTEEVGGHTRFLHDGRARSLEEAILWHGGEAEASKEAFRNMSAVEREQLLAFLRSL